MQRTPPPVWSAPARFFAELCAGGDPVEQALEACVGAVEAGSAEGLVVRRGPHLGDVAARFAAWGRAHVADLDRGGLQALRAVLAALQAMTPPDAQMGALDAEALARLELAAWREQGGDPATGDLMSAVLGAADRHAVEALRAAHGPLSRATLRTFASLERDHPHLSDALWPFAHDDLERAAVERSHTVRRRWRWLQGTLAAVALGLVAVHCGRG